jgi:Holliday junction resolvase-like predicted endonuclease
VIGLVARTAFAWVTWESRHGLRDSGEDTAHAKKHDALRIGTRVETYAYWYLRRLGYIFIARNYMPSRAKGELDRIGYDGDTLALVEVRTRLAVKGQPALPEMSITKEKHEALVRTANYFLCGGTSGNAHCVSMLWPSRIHPANHPSSAFTRLLSARYRPPVFSREQEKSSPLTSIERGEEYNTVSV